MASVKITITVPEEHAVAVRHLVADGQASSVSGFVQHAISVALDDLAGWDRTLDEALAATGGDLSEAERSWADSVLRSSSRSVS